jgi:hypothetical protein
VIRVSPARTPKALGRVRVELPAECLLALLEKQHLTALDMRCLDAHSRYCLRQLLLRACAHRCRRVGG